jgi:hypothetical protein
VRARARKRGRKRAPARSAPPSSWCTYLLRQVPADSPCSIVWLAAGRDGIQIAPAKSPSASAARGHPSAPFCAPCRDTLTLASVHNTIDSCPYNRHATQEQNRLVHAMLVAMLGEQIAPTRSPGSTCRHAVTTLLANRKRRHGMRKQGFHRPHADWLPEHEDLERVVRRDEKVTAHSSIRVAKQKG